MDPPREFMSSSLSSDNPFQTGSADFSFVATDHHEGEITGQMENTTNPPQKDDGILDGGLASNLLKSRGIGWLLEVENVGDEAFEKPLL